MQCAKRQVPPRNMKGFQHLGCASQNAYKHNDFPMTLTAVLRNELQNDQETTSFVRVWELDFAVCEFTSVPKEYEGVSASRLCITECL